MIRPSLSSSSFVGIALYVLYKSGRNSSHVSSVSSNKPNGKDDFLQRITIQPLSDNIVKEDIYYVHTSRYLDTHKKSTSYIDDDDNTDDRHDRDPENSNQTNGPVSTMSKMPSTQPSLRPTSAPVAHPTKIPSISPTIIPSSQSNHPSSYRTSCHKEDRFTFGSVSTPLTVHYQYNVEIIKIISSIMGDSFTSKIQSVESYLLDLIIEAMFPQCEAMIHGASDYENNSTGRQDTDTNVHGHHNIFSSTLEDFNREFQYHAQDINGVIGVSSKPMDIASGELCDEITDYSPQDTEISCYVMDGSFTLYLSHLSTVSRDEETIFLNLIESIMSSGELDFCHASIGRIRFRNGTVNDMENLIHDDTLISNGLGGGGNEFTFAALSGDFALIIASVSAVGFLMILLVRRIHRDPAEEGWERSLQETESSSGDAYIRPNDDDLISCLSLQLTKSFEDSTRNCSFTFSTEDMFRSRDDNVMEGDNSVEILDRNEPSNYDGADDDDDYDVRPSENVLSTTKGRTRQYGNRDFLKSQQKSRFNMFSASNFAIIWTSLKSSSVCQRYCRHFPMLFFIGLIVTLSKAAVDMLGMDLGVQILVTLMILMSVGVVYMIQIYDQHSLAIDPENWLQSSMR